MRIVGDWRAPPLVCVRDVGRECMETLGIYTSILASLAANWNAKVILASQVLGLMQIPGRGGGHCLFEGRYPLPNYRPRFSSLSAP